MLLAMGVETNVEILVQGQAVTAKICGDIDHHTAKNVRDKIDGVIQTGTPKILYMDFSNIQFMDSSGIGLIMGRYKLIKSTNGILKVINIPVRLERMIKMSGLTCLGIF